MKIVSGNPERYVGTRIESQKHELEGLAKSVQMTTSDLANIKFGMHMGGNIAVGARLDMSEFNDTSQLLFTKEFGRLKDYGHKLRQSNGFNAVNPVPCVANCLLFGLKQYDYEQDEIAPLYVLSRTLRHTRESFIGNAAFVTTVDGSEIEGTVTQLGGTENPVDRKDYYDQFYDIDSTDLSRTGQLLVREHVMIIDGQQVDLDSVTSVTRM